MRLVSMGLLFVCSCGGRSPLDGVSAAASPARATMIAASAYDTTAMASDGTVSRWGLADVRASSDLFAFDDSPQPVPGILSAIAIATGGDVDLGPTHGCALLRDGRSRAGAATTPGSSATARRTTPRCPSQSPGCRTRRRSPRARDTRVRSSRAAAFGAGGTTTSGSWATARSWARCLPSTSRVSMASRASLREAPTRARCPRTEPRGAGGRTVTAPT